MVNRIGPITKEAIDHYIHSLQATIITAEHNHDIWWIYKSKDTRPKFLEVMNLYPAFFETSIHAHFVAMLISLYRLYETRRDTINLPQLIEILRRQHSLSDSTENQVATSIKDAKLIWIKVGIIRSEIFAHLNSFRNTEESFKKANIKYREFKELIDFSKMILNLITQDYNQNTHAFNLSSEFDTKAVLTDLVKFHNQKRKRRCLS